MKLLNAKDFIFTLILNELKKLIDSRFIYSVSIYIQLVEIHENL